MSLPSPLEADEPLARFLVSKQDLSVSERRVKERAFLPSPRLRECSVFRIRSLDAREIFILAEEHVRVRRIYGYGLIAVRDVASLDLAVEPAEPPPRHANIVGWPRDPDAAVEAGRQLLIAKQLAMMATLHVADVSSNRPSLPI